MAVGDESRKFKPHKTPELEHPSPNFHTTPIPDSGRPRQTSHREDHHIVRNARVQPTASSAAIQAQGSRHPLRVLHLTPTHRSLRLEWCCARGNWTAAEWNQVVFSDESRFNLSSDRLWSPRGEGLNPAFALQQHTTPTAGVMIWGAVSYNTRSPLELIRGTMITQWYVHDICNHMCFLSCNGSQEPFFNKTMLGLTRQGCHKTVSTLLLLFLGLPYPQICLQSSISGIIWNGELGIPRV
ncbi:transposable element Tcb2 transposase [Trichonephila clavipes]|nr:transposable element Tcb2 transposase [Trichonephila clavipes]